MKEMLDWWKVAPHMWVVWRSVQAMHGAQCVMMDGEPLMQG